MAYDGWNSLSTADPVRSLIQFTAPPMFIRHERFVSSDSRFFVAYKMMWPACNSDSRRCAIQQQDMQVNSVFWTTFKSEVSKRNGINFVDRSLRTKKSYSHSSPTPFDKFSWKLYLSPQGLSIWNRVLIKWHDTPAFASVLGLNLF
jgi:hypothetical protein